MTVKGHKTNYKETTNHRKTKDKTKRVYTTLKSVFLAPCRRGCGALCMSVSRAPLSLNLLDDNYF